MMSGYSLKTGTAESSLSRDDLPIWLDRVSRTFALTIRMLREPFRTYASAAYLLCRIVDTVEDGESLSTDTKCRSLRAFVDRINGDGDAPDGRVGDIFTAHVSWDEHLTLHEPAILAVIRSFPTHIKDIIFRHVVEMTEGMVMFLQQKDEDGSLQFESDEQLDRYCYYVAGTVGLMMNGIYADLSGNDRTEAGQSAVELGIGLQLTNIVKDIRKDRARNINYCPTEIAVHWPGPAATHRTEDTDREILSLASATIFHLTAGKEYILGLETNYTRYKLFCITNYLLAWKTLEICLANPRRTASPRGSRISRRQVYSTLLESRVCLTSSRFLNWRVDRLCGICTSLVLHGTK